jgi:hypothetical protein
MVFFKVQLGDSQRLAHFNPLAFIIVFFLRFTIYKNVKVKTEKKGISSTGRATVLHTVG